MGKKKREEPSPEAESPGEPFHSPFAALGGLRAELPEGEPAVARETVAGVPGTSDGERWIHHKLVVRHERKGHGGKTVTRLEGVIGEDERQALARRLAKALGCGTRVEAEAVVLSGDLRARLVGWLNAQGARRVVTGS